MRPGQTPPQVEEQADGPRVRPLQVVQDQEQGMIPRQCLQHAGDLVEEEGLRGRPHPMVQHLLHPRRPGRAVRQGPCQFQERRTGKQGIDQRRPTLQHGLQRCRGDLAQPPGVLAAQGARSAPRFHIPGEQEQHLHEGQVGVAQAKVSIAVAPGHHQVRIGVHGPASERAQ